MKSKTTTGKMTQGGIKPAWNTDGHAQGNDAARAAAWHKWFHVLERGAQPLSDRMVELAGIQSGHRVLDVATGLGEPAVTAAKRVGADGKVEAIDISAHMLTYARQRATDLGLGNIDFLEMDAEALPAPTAPFDAILCRWGLMFMLDLGSTLESLKRCLAPAGRFVAAVWGPPERAPSISLSARVVLDYLNMPAPEEGILTPFALSDVEALLRQVETAGFKDVHGEWVSIEYKFESAEAFAQFRRDHSAKLTAQIAHHPKERQEAAWRAVTEAARRYAAPDGAVCIVNDAYCVVAR